MAARLSFKILLLLGFAAGPAGAADSVGSHFDILPKDMPAPYSTPAVENSSRVVPRPVGVLLQVPKGFAIRPFAAGLSDPRWMAVAPNGDVFLAEPGAGKITLLRGGETVMATTFAIGFNKPHGLAFHDGALYVGDVDAVWKLA